MPPAELEQRPLKVLLVEDNPDDALLLERHLRRHGFAPEVSRVETADEMLAALQRALPPDVVLADYNLPRFSGPEALQLLRASGVDIPFIMMSGAVSEETAVESMRAGAQDYVGKQNLTRLIPALERELKEARARRRRVAAELALRASEARFHRLVEAMPLSLLISAASGRIIYANGAAERLLGYAPGNILLSGAVTLDSICPVLSETYGSLTKQEIAIEPFEASCITTGGQSVDVLIGVALLNPEADPADQQFAAFLADLTHQKKSEEMLRRTEKLAVAGRLAASIAHEINNPLEAITNCLYLLSTAELSSESRTYLALAQKELDRVTQITVQTLRFYRRSTRPSQTDIHELIGTVVALFESRLTALQITVIRQFRANQLILAHDGEIRQVIVNLIGNAIDALPDGGKIIIRTISTRDSSGRQGIRLTVADTGVGMDGEVHSHLFEPFFSTKGITGAGLGLWVSREIVDKHQGSLRARSRQATATQRGGTVFVLFIPAAIDPTLTTESEDQAAVEMA
jgi:PAS domain S-box-containing protein